MKEELNTLLKKNIEYEKLREKYINLENTNRQIILNSIFSEYSNNKNKLDFLTNGIKKILKKYHVNNNDIDLKSNINFINEILYIDQIEINKNNSVLIKRNGTPYSNIREGCYIIGQIDDLYIFLGISSISFDFISGDKYNVQLKIVLDDDTNTIQKLYMNRSL